MFQSTFPRGERQQTLNKRLHVKKFQSTFPRGERHSDRRCYRCHCASFNPRSREGNDRLDILRRSSQNSFNPRSREGNDHASSSGTTFVLKFQSTFPRGERRMLQKKMGASLLFQSTFPRGERRLARFLNDAGYKVSIHVPARGTTWMPGSISRSEKFQSTFPRGERHGCGGISEVILCFNPRSREGND